MSLLFQELASTSMMTSSKSIVYAASRAGLPALLLLACAGFAWAQAPEMVYKGDLLTFRAPGVTRSARPGSS